MNQDPRHIARDRVLVTENTAEALLDKENVPHVFKNSNASFPSLKSETAATTGKPDWERTSNTLFETDKLFSSPSSCSESSTSSRSPSVSSEVSSPETTYVLFTSDTTLDDSMTSSSDISSTSEDELSDNEFFDDNVVESGNDGVDFETFLTNSFGGPNYFFESFDEELVEVFDHWEEYSASEALKPSVNTLVNGQQG